MRQLTTTATTLALYAAASGAAGAAPHTLMTHHVPAATRTAALVAHAPADRHFRLAITLPLHHEKVLDALLEALDNPGSPQFRHYLSVQDFTARFGPSAAEYEALRQFALTRGLRIMGETPNRFVLDIDATTDEIERHFGVRMNVYRRRDGNGTFVAPDHEPTIDTPMQVLHIGGLDDYAGPLARGSRHAGTGRGIQATGTGPSGSYTGADMRLAYAGTTSLTGAGQTVALVEFIGYNIDDVENYFTSLGETLPVPVHGISVDGTPLSCTGTCDDFEPSIDIEQTIAMAPGLKQVDFYIGGTVIDILNRIATDDSAKTISSSYGWPAEAAVEDPVYKEFRAQGQSFLDGSGDLGYKLEQGGVWPADDAHVTGVGGTVLTMQGGVWEGESGWQDSGGGPSPNGTPIPLWQKAAIDSGNSGSSTLRNVPDVAMEAAYDSYACYDSVCTGNNGGTSFSAPRWAGFVALVNQEAVKETGATIGFLNRRLYKLAKGDQYHSLSHDMSTGFNGKYYAISGYDLVTGIGSPQPSLIATLAGRAK